jgi:hypothetical protein
MPSPFHTIEADGISVTLDLRAGHIRELVITRDGRRLTPFHTAPWVDDPSITSDETIPSSLRFLSGDFFCAPFSTSDVENAPPHGWTANSPWRHTETVKEPAGVTALYQLERPVMGARVEKRFTLRNNHPFLYETHVFSGGAGAVPVANHAMVRLPASGRIAFSAKHAIETPPAPLEADPATGRSRLAYPARTEDPTRFPMADGGFADITHYPFAERHEDFIMLVEKRENRLGWFVASRPGNGDAMISLKNPAEFPVTFLWFSNGGRDYAPWNGHHSGVLGIEEGRANSILGHRASVEPNALSETGTPTALTLHPNGQVAIHNVIGALPLPPSGSPIAGVQHRAGALDLLCEDGARVSVPLDTAFLDRA